MNNNTEKYIFILIFYLFTLFAIGSIEAQEDIRLIIRGDDLGMTQGSLVAFEQAFNNGVLTCASLQVPAPWFEGAAELINKNPGWCIGIHLTLVAEWRGHSWKPVSPYNKIPSLVNEDGYFFTCPAELISHNPKPDEVEAELRAQIELAKKRGVKISYIDNHYNAVVKCLGGQEILEKITQDYDIPVSGQSCEKRLEGIYIVPEDKKLESAVQQLEKLSPGLWLCVCHPGIDSPEQNALIHTAPKDIFDGGGVGAHRKAVLETLISNQVKSIILKREIKLIDYTEVEKKSSLKYK